MTEERGRRPSVSQGAATDVVPGVHAALGRLLTPAQVSEYLGVPLGTLANWRYLSKGPAFLRVGRHVRYKSADLARWVDCQLRDAGVDVVGQSRRTAS